MIRTVLVTEGDEKLEALVATALPEAKILRQPSPLELSKLEHASQIDALCITVRSPVREPEMQRMPNLRIIVTGSAGYDHIDTAAAASRDITVCSVPRYGPAVAEFNMALMLSLARNLHTAHVNTLQRDFSLEGIRGRNLFGKKLGIIGTGNIGAYLANLARAFGMSVVAYDPFPNASLEIEYVPLGELLRHTDFIAICCPLTNETQHMIGEAEFRSMKRGVLIVNTSRGAVIDTQALVWALDEGIVAGAALDVLEGETLLPREALLKTLGGNPDFEQTQTIAEDLTLIRHPKVLVTPHMAYYTEDSLAAIREQTAENLRMFESGRPVNVVGGAKARACE
jgi:D-lactate dehydrogenase